MSVVQELRNLKHCNPNLLLKANRRQLYVYIKAKGYTEFEDSIRRQAGDVLRDHTSNQKVYQAKLDGMFPESELNKLK